MYMLIKINGIDFWRFLIIIFLLVIGSYFKVDYKYYVVLGRRFKCFYSGILVYG